MRVIAIVGILSLDQVLRIVWGWLEPIKAGDWFPLLTGVAVYLGGPRGGPVVGRATDRPVGVDQEGIRIPFPIVKFVIGSLVGQIVKLVCFFSPGSSGAYSTGLGTAG